MRDEIIASLQSALKCLAEISPICVQAMSSCGAGTSQTGNAAGPRIREMSSVDEALAELGLVTTPPRLALGGSCTRKDRAKLPQAPGPVIIPKFDTLRKMEERYGAQHLAMHAPDERRSTKPLAIAHEPGRRRRQSRTISAVRRTH